VIGGIVSATLLTLVVLPALYRMFHRRYATVRPCEPED
jgi:Cu/Ag efflux pump CusA